MFSEDFDPQNTYKVKKISGENIPDGVEAIFLDFACADRVSYQFHRFKIPAVYLEIAKNAEKNAIDLIPCIKQEKAGKKQIKLFSDENGSVWNYFSYLFTSVVFSYMALEANVNAMLPKEINTENYINIPALSEIKKNSALLILKSEVERQCSLDQKIFEILPGIKNFNTSNLKRERSNFLNLSKLRNILMHLKDNDVRTGRNKKENILYKKIWDRLIPRFREKKLRFYPSVVSLKIINELKKADGQK